MFAFLFLTCIIAVFAAYVMFCLIFVTNRFFICLIYKYYETMIRRISTVLLVAALSFNAFGQNNEWKEAKSGGYTYKYVTNDPTNSRFYTLKNGLTVI